MQMHLRLIGAALSTAPLIILLAFVAYSLLHSFLAARGVKARVREHFGKAGERYYRLFYNLVGVLSFLPILALLAVLPGEGLYRWPAPWVYLALFGQFLGAAIIFVGLLQTGFWSFFGLSWVFGDPAPGADQLITTGLYRWMRHPLYTGGLLLLWLMPAMTTSLLAFNLAATLYLYVGSRFEERRLIASYGDDYRSYQRQVPRLIPRPWRKYSPCK